MAKRTTKKKATKKKTTKKVGASRGRGKGSSSSKSTEPEQTPEVQTTDDAQNDELEGSGGTDNPAGDDAQGDATPDADRGADEVEDLGDVVSGDGEKPEEGKEAEDAPEIPLEEQINARVKLVLSDVIARSMFSVDAYATIASRYGVPGEVVQDVIREVCDPILEGLKPKCE